MVANVRAIHTVYRDCVPQPAGRVYTSNMFPPGSCLQASPLACYWGMPSAAVKIFWLNLLAGAC